MTDELGREELLKQLDAIYIGYRLFLTRGVQYKKKKEINDSKFVKHKDRAFRQIKILIQKPEITEKFIEEKARELLEVEVDFRKGLFSDNSRLDAAKDFIRSIYKEIVNK